ncbi:MAG: hypothetical protein PUP92_29895 [Rhizonema sp. PD38]|nr:hypothetical protein [Rhizonema sp. PD38]
MTSNPSERRANSDTIGEQGTSSACSMSFLLAADILYLIVYTYLFPLPSASFILASWGLILRSTSLILASASLI